MSTEAQFIISAKERTKPAFNQIKRNLRLVEQQSNRTEQAISRIMSPLSAYAAFAGVRRLSTDFGDFDEALIKVGKTTDIEGAALDDFGKKIRNMDIPIQTRKLLEYAEAAGQLGVSGSKNLLTFVDTMARLEKSSDIAGADGAKAIARIINITGEGVDTVDRFGSVIVSLGNKFEASEQEVVKHTSEVSRAIAIHRVSAAQSAALGAAMSALAIKAEGGGSVVGRTFNAIKKAIKGGGEQLQKLITITGMTEQQLKQTFDTNASKVFTSFLTGLKKMDTGIKGNMIPTLEAFGLKGEEVNKTIPIMARGIEKVKMAMKLASKEVKNATALNIESNRAFKAYNAELDKTKKSLTNVSVEIGERLSPIISGASQGIREFIGDTEDIRTSIDTLSDFAMAGLVAITAGYTTTLGLSAKAQITSIITTNQKTKASQVESAQKLATAKSEHAYALSVYKSTQAQKIATIGSAQYTAAAATELAARTRLTASIVGLRGAQSGYNVVAAQGTVITRGLSATMGLLGGPTGLVMIAAGALAYFATSTSDADKEGKEFSRTLDEILGKQQAIATKVLNIDVEERMAKIKLLQIGIKDIHDKLQIGFNQKLGIIEQGIIDDNIADISLLGKEISKIKAKITSINAEPLVVTPKTLVNTDGDVGNTDGGAGNTEDPLAQIRRDQLQSQYLDLQTALMSEDELLLQTATKRQLLIAELWQSGVITDAAKYGELATQANDQYLAALDAIEQQELARNEAKLARLDEQWLTEREKINLQQTEELEQYQSLFDSKFITEEQFEIRRLKLEQKYKEKRQALTDAENKAKVNMVKEAFYSVLGIAAKNSKTAFKIQKTAALADIGVNLPPAIVKAFNNGGGLPWGIPPALMTAAAGLKQINNIKKQSFGGSSSVSSSIGGSGGSPSPVIPNKNTNVESSLSAGLTAGNNSQQESVRNYFIIEGDLVGNSADVMFEQIKEKIETTDAVLIEPGTRQAEELSQG